MSVYANYMCLMSVEARSGTLGDRWAVNCCVLADTQTEGLSKGNSCFEALSQLSTSAIPLLSWKYRFRVPIAIKRKCIWGRCPVPMLQGEYVIVAFSVLFALPIDFR